MKSVGTKQNYIYQSEENCSNTQKKQILFFTMDIISVSNSITEPYVSIISN